jgi:hypothetical protein
MRGCTRTRARASPRHARTQLRFQRLPSHGRSTGPALEQLLITSNIPCLSDNRLSQITVICRRSVDLDGCIEVCVISPACWTANEPTSLTIRKPSQDLEAYVDSHAVPCHAAELTAHGCSGSSDCLLVVANVATSLLTESPGDLATAGGEGPDR